MLIPTTFKAPLGAGLSYPIGAEALSHSLSGIPQLSAVALAFFAKPTLFASDFQHLLGSNRPHAVVRASYANHHPGLCAPRRRPLPSLYGEHWAVHVFPVPQRERHHVKRLLVAGGLSHLRTWLATPRPDTWRTGRHYCELLCSYTTDTVVLLHCSDESSGPPLALCVETSSPGAA